LQGGEEVGDGCGRSVLVRDQGRSAGGRRCHGQTSRGGDSRHGWRRVALGWSREGRAAGCAGERGEVEGAAGGGGGKQWVSGRCNKDDINREDGAPALKEVHDGRGRSSDAGQHGRGVNQWHNWHGNQSGGEGQQPHVGAEGSEGCRSGKDFKRGDCSRRQLAAAVALAIWNWVGQA
jgi:hypothetical protein